jgi:predicted enzyme related to lactoylglutathione lyase
MTEVTSYTTGQPTWADVTNPDVEAAARFYSELFGWEVERDPRPEAGGYTMFSRNGKHVAAASPPPREGVPTVWTVYLATDDVDATAARVREAGGTLMMDPFDVFDSGRMTVAADPSGAVFGLWQAGSHIGSEVRNEPGTMNWAEVQTRDRAAAQPFYEQVFGYGTAVREMAPGSEYVVFEVNGQPAAGLVEIGADWGDVPSNWSVVFEVADCDAAVAKVQELGGRLLHGPDDIEGIGRFAVVADPWGATFQMIT